MNGEICWLIVAPQTSDERAVPVSERLFVGRECAGIEPASRVIIDHPSVSRDHFQLLIDPALGPRLIDLSTNGTRVNGRRVERGEPIQLSDGDRIEIGGVQLAFRASPSADVITRRIAATAHALGAIRVAAVVGDVVGYTSITELHGGKPVASVMEKLFTSLRDVVRVHGGTVIDYAGDAIYTAWYADADLPAATNAVRFALDACELVGREGSSEPLRDLLDAPLTMGWAVTFGDVVTGRPSPGRELIYGDAINLAFRLSGLAARGGRPPVLASAEVVDVAPHAAAYEPLEQVRVRGRESSVQLYAVRRAAAFVTQ